MMNLWPLLVSTTQNTLKPARHVAIVKKVKCGQTPQHSASEFCFENDQRAFDYAQIQIEIAQQADVCLARHSGRNPSK